MEVGIAIIMLILLFTTYVIVQETRAQLHWRTLVESGDVDAIRTLLDEEIDTWHRARVPRGMPALLWHGIQTVELLDANNEGARVSCNAEGEYALVRGKRLETSSPLAEGMKTTMKLAEMLLYDIPNVKLDRFQIDVYTSFRDDSGHAEPRCVLSTLVERHIVEHIDWEETEPVDFAALNDARFDASTDGSLKEIEPLNWAEPEVGDSPQRS